MRIISRGFRKRIFSDVYLGVFAYSQSQDSRGLTRPEGGRKKLRGKHTSTSILSPGPSSERTKLNFLVNFYGHF